jgi:PhnB protein
MELSMHVQPYLFFDGRCEEAIEFYKRAVGAKVEMLLRFKDSPVPPQGSGDCAPAPGTENKVMHATIRIGDSAVNVSDGRGTGHPKFEGVSMSLTVENDDKAESIFKALADCGQVQMPMATTFFSSRFGMVADRFGVVWMVLVGK